MIQWADLGIRPSNTRGKVNSMKREQWSMTTHDSSGEPTRVAIRDLRATTDPVKAPKMAEGTATQWASFIISTIQAVANLDPNSQALPVPYGRCPGVWCE